MSTQYNDFISPNCSELRAYQSKQANLDNIFKDFKHYPNLLVKEKFKYSYHGKWLYLIEGFQAFPLTEHQEVEQWLGLIQRKLTTISHNLNNYDHLSVLNYNFWVISNTDVSEDLLSWADLAEGRKLQFLQPPRRSARNYAANVERSLLTAWLQIGSYLGINHVDLSDSLEDEFYFACTGPDYKDGYLWHSSFDGWPLENKAKAALFAEVMWTFVLLDEGAVGSLAAGYMIKALCIATDRINTDYIVRLWRAFTSKSDQEIEKILTRAESIDYETGPTLDSEEATDVIHEYATDPHKMRNHFIHSLGSFIDIMQERWKDFHNQLGISGRRPFNVASSEQMFLVETYCSGLKL